VKAITLHQPWASLIAAGFKRVETRSWPTNHRGQIAIHAGRTSAAAGIDAVEGSFDDCPPGHIEVMTYLYSTPLHLGAVVCTAEIVDCVRMDAEVIAKASPIERALGDWRPDRYAWVLDDVRPIEPVVAMGARGIWGLDMATSAAVAAAVVMGVH
jgi:activating signal cointegrator 1